MESPAGPVSQDQPLSLGACIAGALAVFTTGSMLSVLGASWAFPFPFYKYFEPTDYLRIAPTWGVVLIGSVAGVLFVLVFKSIRGEKIITLSEKEWNRAKRHQSINALLYLGFLI